MGCKSKKPKAVSKSRPRITKVPVLLKSNPKRRKAEPKGKILAHLSHVEQPLDQSRETLLGRIAKWFIP